MSSFENYNLSPITINIVLGEFLMEIFVIIALIAIALFGYWAWCANNARKLEAKKPDVSPVATPAAQPIIAEVVEEAKVVEAPKAKKAKTPAKPKAAKITAKPKAEKKPKNLKVAK